MICSNIVNVTINPKLGSHFKSLGYEPNLCKQGKRISVRVNDLLENSNIRVLCACDVCGVLFNRQYQLLVRSGSPHRCYSCARIHIGKTMNRTKIDAATRSRRGSRHPRWNPNKPSFRAYSNRVHWLSERTYQMYQQEINPNNYPRTLCGILGGYQLDHMVSIKKAFEMGMLEENCASRDNLQMLPWKINRSKHSK